MTENRTVLILAAGEAVRWAGSPMKQLMPIQGVPIIVRTCRLVAVAGHAPIVVTQHQEILNAVAPKGGAAFSFTPHGSRWLVETLLSTRLWWGEQTVVLMGDAVYTAELMRSIMQPTPDVMFWGQPHELLAMSFSDQERVLSALRRVVEDAERGGEGKMWSLYRQLNGIPPQEHRLDGIFTLVQDVRVGDTDTVDAYINLQLQWESR